MKTFNKFFVTFLLINQSSAEVCQNDEECAENLTCFNQNCTNLCSPYQCATNAECLTINHQINCKCKEGFSGDGWIECINFFVDGKIDTDQFCNWNDKINSECRQISIFYIIDGVINSENYKIDPKFKDLSVEGFEIASEKINPNLNLLPKVDEIFPNLITYKASLQSIEKIKSEYFKNLKLLKQLNLQENLISEIENFAFDDLIELKFLDLSGNKIENLNESLFKKNLNLEFLDIGRNKIKNLGSKLLENLSELQQIWTGKNQIEEIEENFFKNNLKLQKIDFGTNKLTKIDEDIFKNQENLTHLFLHHNKIKNVPENFIKNCHKLEIIRLDSNEISNFSSIAFKNLPELRKIRLDFNKIQILDENFLQNSFKVEKIFLNINKIKIMSSKIVKNKTNLMYLGLTGSPCIDAFYGFRATLDVLTETERNEAENDILFGCNENF